LYQSYENFLWAVVLLAHDSTVFVKIASQGRTGLTFGTLRTTSSFESMRSTMAWSIAQGPLPEDAPITQEQTAPLVRLYPVTGLHVVEGKLFAIKGKTVAIEVSDSGNGSRWLAGYGWIRTYSFGELRMAVLPAEPSGSGGGEIIIGIFGGAVLGGVIGSAVAEGRTGFGPPEEAVYGVLIGILVGGVTGAIIGTIEPSDEELHPERFERLGKYARYTGADAELIMRLHDEGERD
jgi:hypothetical protein